MLLLYHRWTTISITGITLLIYRVIYKGWDFRVDCTDFILSRILYIYDSLQLFSFLSKSFSKPLKGSIRAEDFFSSYFNDLKSSLQSNPLWVTLYIGVCNFARGYFPSGNFPNDNVPNGNFPIVNFPNYQFPK